MAVSRETLKLANGLRVAILATLDATDAAILRAWGNAWNELASEWDHAIADLVAASKHGRWPSAAKIRRAKRAQAALAATREALAELAKQLPVTVADALPKTTQEAADWQRRLTASQLPASAGGLATVDPDALAAIVKRTTGRIVSLSRPLSVQAEAAMRAALIKGVAVGDNPRKVGADMLRRVRGGFDGGRTRALVISRTEMLSAHREASHAQFNANAKVLDGWEWLSALDKRTCIACFSKHGTFHPLSERGPDGHQQCVLPGTVLSGPAPEASTTRWFDGEVIDIETRDGRVLSVTENHPVLTANGWVRAGQLREGDDVVAGTGADRPTLQRSPHDHQVPALVEDVAQTLGGPLPVDAVSVPTAAEDFHGDGAGSEVHVVRTNGFLRDHIEPAGPEGVGELALMVRDVSLAELARRCTLALLLEGLLDSAGRGVRGSTVPPVLFGASVSHHGTVDLGTSSPLHVCGIEANADGGPRYAVRLRKRQDRLPSEVSADDVTSGQSAIGVSRGSDLGAAGGVALGLGAPVATLDEDSLEAPLAYPMPSGDDLATFAGDVVLDRVVNVLRRSWSGHVYNFQTATGWYLANGILTHNCRCAAIPATKPWKDLGFNIPEPPSLMPDAEDVFNAMGREEQLAVMGKTRLDLYQSGKVSWADLATKRENTGWRPSWVPTPVSDLAS